MDSSAKIGRSRRRAQFVSAHSKRKVLVSRSVRRSKAERSVPKIAISSTLSATANLVVRRSQKWRRNFKYLRDCPPRHFNLLLPPLSAYSRSLSLPPSSAPREVLYYSHSLSATHNRYFSLLFLRRCFSM